MVVSWTTPSTLLLKKVSPQNLNIPTKLLMLNVNKLPVNITSVVKKTYPQVIVILSSLPFKNNPSPSLSMLTISNSTQVVFSVNVKTPSITVFSSLVTALPVNIGKLKTPGLHLGVNKVTLDLPLVTPVVSVTLLHIPLHDFDCHISKLIQFNVLKQIVKISTYIMYVFQ